MRIRSPKSYAAVSLHYPSVLSLFWPLLRTQRAFKWTTPSFLSMLCMLMNPGFLQDVLCLTSLVWPNVSSFARIKSKLKLRYSRTQLKPIRSIALLKSSEKSVQISSNFCASDWMQYGPENRHPNVRWLSVEHRICPVVSRSKVLSPSYSGEGNG